MEMDAVLLSLGKKNEKWKKKNKKKNNTTE